MRITGGEWRGRVLKTPAQGVRPTQDRMRQSLFNSLGAFVADARVLDLFAGSGALGLEALSRGAVFVCWVEQHPRTFQLLKDNVEALAGRDRERTRFFRADARQLDLLAGLEFDLVVADPPYEQTLDGTLLTHLLTGLAARGIVRVGGLVAYEQDGAAPPVAVEGWALARDRTMGGSRQLLYRREA